MTFRFKGTLGQKLYEDIPGYHTPAALRNKVKAIDPKFRGYKVLMYSRPKTTLGVIKRLYVGKDTYGRERTMAEVIWLKGAKLKGTTQSHAVDDLQSVPAIIEAYRMALRDIETHAEMR